MLSMRGIAPTIILIIVSGAQPGARAQAQQRLKVTDFDICRSCVLERELVVQLGDADGAGIIESEATRVMYHPRTGIYGVYQIGGTYVKLFGADGRYIRTLGRRGEGPGELSAIIDVRFTSEGDILILDYTGPKWLKLSPEGDVLVEARSSIPAGRFLIVGHDSVVVGVMDRTPDAVGYPLHLVRVTEGKPLRRFGSQDGEFNAADPWAGIVLLARASPQQRVWWGSPGKLHFEEWSTDGRLLRVVEGEPEWFPAAVRSHIPGSGEPPPVLLSRFAVDRQDRLWMLTERPDPDWRSVRISSAGRETRIDRAQENDYYDVRLDILDVRSKRHIGRYIWDQRRVYVFPFGNELGISVVEYDQDMVPRVSVYAIRFRGI